MPRPALLVLGLSLLVFPCAAQPQAQPQTMPGETTCTVTEMIMRNEIEFVRVGCDVLNVYPEPVCRFYRTTDGGEPVPLMSEPISYPTKNEGSVSYNSFVQVKVELTELGEGIHTFHAYCFPNVTDGQELVNVTSPAENVTLSFPRAVHSCPPSLAEDYLCGRPTSCNCSLVSPGRPKGSASWFYQAQFPRADPVTLTYDENMPNIFYTCEGTSALGRAYGSTLRVDIDTECV